MGGAYRNGAWLVVSFLERLSLRMSAWIRKYLRRGQGALSEDALRLLAKEGEVDGAPLAAREARHQGHDGGVAT